MPDDLKNIVEAVLLAADGPVSVARIQGLFDESARPEAARVHAALEALREECRNRGVELKKIGSGYRYHTREKYAEYLRRLHAVRPPRMSRALLETLAIIAYRQPASRGDIEEVRGVAVSADIIQRLVERGWIKQVGVRDVPGHPALFGTTQDFLSYFNLGSLKELPDLAEQRDLMTIVGEMEVSLPQEVLVALEASADADAGGVPEAEQGADGAGPERSGETTAPAQAETNISPAEAADGGLEDGAVVSSAPGG